MTQPSKVSPSGLLIALQNIEEMLLHISKCINSVSGQMLAVATAVECITLSLKLQQTLQRWSIYLPFHECIDVKFKSWVERLSMIHKQLNGMTVGHDAEPDGFCYPDTPFSIDFAHMLDDEADNSGESGTDIDGAADETYVFTPHYAKDKLSTDVEEYNGRLNELIERINTLSETEEEEWRTRIDDRAVDVLHRQYADYLRFMCISREYQLPSDVENVIVPQVGTYLETVTRQSVMDYCLDMALSTLIDYLRQIDDLFSSDIDEEQFLRLTHRLYHRYCPDAEQMVSREVHRWTTAWPGRRRQDRSRQKREQILDALRQKFESPALSDYIDIERPNPLDDVEFGRFLFAERHQLTDEDVRQLFMDCLRIRQLNQLIDPTAAETDIHATQLNPQRRTYYARLKELVRQTRWQNNLTSEDVERCFAELLLPQPGRQRKTETGTSTSTIDYDQVSEKFWQLLTNRRGCGKGFRSLRLTWLNLVGYFRSRGVITGSTLSLYRQYYRASTTDQDESDYNAILKGADHRAPNDFKDLRLILDQMLHLSPKG